MLNHDEPAECPLCMEPLEMDDVNFFPCTCGYQICRFCWHRIRTDENGLCPACRKAYPECPADFKPLSEEQLHRIKNEKRQKDIQRKQKITENRKHLASVRVVQKNLVFVVGLSQRLADAEILKKQEYFGKFGKILKVVINQNTSYAGSQGPSASAYVTYQRAEDSLRAIQAVNNVHVDGRTLKASLGTTKYCSHFLKNAPCPKPDCMYLHELGDEAASFTKEDMQMGKHQEYEQRLLHELLGGGSQAHSPGSSHNTHTTSSTTSSSTTNSTTAATSATTSAATTTAGERTRSQSNSRKKQPSPPTTQPPRATPNNTSAESWPSLSKSNGGGGGGESKHTEEKTAFNSSSTTETQINPDPPNIHKLTANGHTTEFTDTLSHTHSSIAPPIDIPQPRVLSDSSSLNNTPQDASPQVQSIPDLLPPAVTDTRQPGVPPGIAPPRAPFHNDITNLFGGNGFLQQTNLTRHIPQVPLTGVPTQNNWNDGGWTANTDMLPVESQTDWQAAFGFASEMKDKQNEDDLGFDPWKESSQGLADLLEKELQINPPSRLPQPPPGFNLSNHSLPFIPAPRPVRPDVGGSKILPWMQHTPTPAPTHAPPSTQPTGSQPIPPPPHPHPNHMPRFPSHPLAGQSPHSPNPLSEHMHLKTWQDGLRALLPNINISFGTGQQQSFTPETSRLRTVQNEGDSWVGSPTGSSWAVQDPAIISITGGVGNSDTNTEATTAEDKPHWLESLQNLTETDSPTQIPTQQTNHFFPSEHIHNRSMSWNNHIPPPGFRPAQIRPMGQTTEPHTITENL